MATRMGSWFVVRNKWKKMAPSELPDHFAEFNSEVEKFDAYNYVSRFKILATWFDVDQGRKMSLPFSPPSWFSLRQSCDLRWAYLLSRWEAHSFSYFHGCLASLSEIGCASYRRPFPRFSMWARWPQYDTGLVMRTSQTTDLSMILKARGSSAASRLTDSPLMFL